MTNRSRSGEKHREFLRRTLALAQKAAELGNEPFAALLVVENEVVLEALNSVATDNSPTAHAEMNLLRQARREISNARLARATLYCSTEPCMMCAGDIARTPIKHVVYGRPGDPSVSGRAILIAAEPAVRVEGPVLTRPRQKARADWR